MQKVVDSHYDIVRGKLLSTWRAYNSNMLGMLRRRKTCWVRGKKVIPLEHIETVEEISTSVLNSKTWGGSLSMTWWHFDKNSIFREFRGMRGLLVRVKDKDKDKAGVCIDVGISPSPEDMDQVKQLLLQQSKSNSRRGEMENDNT